MNKLIKNNENSGQEAFGLIKFEQHALRESDEKAKLFHI